MSIEQEYQELLELYIQIGEAVKGEKLPAEKAWLYDTEQLAVKLLSHVLSLFYLYHGTNLDRVTPLRIAFFDFPSALVLLRAALEAYLTFCHIFIEPRDVREKMFRYKVWRYGGYLEKQRLGPVITIDEHRKALMSEHKAMKQLLQEIIQDTLYLKLSPDIQKCIREKGDWKFKQGWKTLAGISGFDKEAFGCIYSYLCSHSHSGFHAITQIRDADGNTQKRHIKVWLPIGMALMANFVHACASIWPKAQEVLSTMPSEKKALTKFWKDAGLVLRASKA